MKKITKAVITAGGLGTRMLPVAKAIPKEMLPIVDKPALQYLVEEAAASGITDILIITNRDKHNIDDYFDYSPEYEAKLAPKKDGAQAVAAMRSVADLARIFYVRQKETRGLGHAVLQARSFVGDDDFIVMYGDDVIISDTVPVCRQLIETYERYGGGVGVAGVSRVSREDISRYCSLKVEQADTPGEFFVSDMVEKPDAPEKIFSDLAILGRVLLTPEIFDILERQPTGYGGELQLTDAMQTFSRSRERGMMARIFEGRRHDIGDKLGFLKANVEEGLRHPELGAAFAEYLRERMNKKGL